MHLPMRVRGQTVVALLGSLILVGCHEEVRQRAGDLSQQLRTAVTQRDQDVQTCVRALAETCYHQLNERLAAERRERIATVKAEIYRLAEVKANELDTLIAQRLEDALDGDLAVLQATLKQEQEKARAAGQGTTMAEIQAAAAQSTTLALAQKAIADLQAGSRKQITTTRDDLLTKVDLAFAGMGPAVDPKHEAAQLIAALDGGTEYLNNVNNGFAELDRYIHLDSPVGLFLNGLLGEKVGALVTGKIESSLGNVEKRAKAELEERSKGIPSASDAFTSLLTTIVKR